MNKSSKKVGVFVGIAAAIITGTVMSYFIPSALLDLYGLIYISTLTSYLLYVWFKQTGNLQSLNSTWLSIKPEIELYHHGIFWVPIGAFSFLALWVGLFTTNVSLNAFTNPILFIDAMKLPVTVLALAIPFTVAIGRFHASAQRNKSNKISEKTMSFKHHFEHKTAFFKHMEVGKQYEQCFEHFELVHPNKLYSFIYPRSNINHFDINPPIEHLRQISAGLLELSKKFIKYGEVYAEAGGPSSPTMQPPPLDAASDALEPLITRTLTEFGLALSKPDKKSTSFWQSSIFELQNDNSFSYTLLHNLGGILLYALKFYESQTHATVFSGSVKQFQMRSFSGDLTSFNQIALDVIRYETCKLNDTKKTVQRQLIQ